jgi:single-strand DNA-binding protein
VASENKVLLMGNLTKDPDLRYTPNGQAVAVFTVAINRRYKNAAGELVEKTDFVPIEVWRKQAEHCKQYLNKGSAVYLEGRLQTDSWEAEDGTKRSKMKVVALRVQFMGKPGGAKSEAAKSAVATESPETEIAEGEEEVPF